MESYILVIIGGFFYFYFKGRILILFIAHFEMLESLIPCALITSVTHIK